MVNAIHLELELDKKPQVQPPAIDRQSKMRTPRAVSSFLALSGLLLLAVSVAATGYGASPAENGYAGGGGHHDAQAGSNGYGGGGDGAAAGSNGGGDDDQEGSYTVPAYQKPVDGLDEGYYAKSCPDMEKIVGTAVTKAVEADETLAASIIRLFFHDFVVGGVDASVLIDVPGHSEKYAEASRTLRGFELIEEIKKELEAKCHATVSCADVLTAAARDAAASRAVGAPYWSLKYGRKDRKGYFAAGTADRDVPMGGQSVTQLVALFEKNGLNIQDLVALSGAHTIGRATCGAVRPGLLARLEAGTLNWQYGDFLQRKCGAGGDAEYVELDGETPTAFDNQYYKNLLHGKGLLDTDQKLLADSRTGGFVKAFAYQKPQVFVHQFAHSMKRLGEVQVLTGNEGEVRRKCSAVNY